MRLARVHSQATSAIVRIRGVPCVHKLLLLAAHAITRSVGFCHVLVGSGDLPSRPHPNCKCEIEFVGKIKQNNYVKNDIMERLSPYVAVKVTYRSNSHYADIYLETFTTISELLPNDATQDELDNAYQMAIHMLDISRLAGTIPENLISDFSNMIAKEAVELALAGLTKDDFKNLSATKAAQIIATKALQKVLGFWGAGLGKVLFYPSEANPLTPEEKRKKKQ